MANLRKKKAKLDHITVEYLQKHHYFDMPLAVSFNALLFSTLTSTLCARQQLIWQPM